MELLVCGYTAGVQVQHGDNTYEERQAMSIQSSDPIPNVKLFDLDDQEAPRTVSAGEVKRRSVIVSSGRLATTQPQGCTIKWK
jgi:hypothetical protein